MSYQVKYDEHHSDGTVDKQKTHVCFSGIYRNNTDAKKTIGFEYRGFVRDVLTDKEINNWIAFLSELLDASRFTHELVEKDALYGMIHFDGERKRKVIWNFNCKGFSRQKALLYLTAFRYLDEYEQIVQQVSKAMDDGKTFEEVYGVFQQAHQQDTKKNYLRQCVGGHSLMYHYASDVNALNISLADFRTNLEQDLQATVNNFFQVVPAKAPKKEPVKEPVRAAVIPPVAVKAAPAPVVPKPVAPPKPIAPAPFKGKNVIELRAARLVKRPVLIKKLKNQKVFKY